jgi:hypothetical protein
VVLNHATYTRQIFLSRTAQPVHPDPAILATMTQTAVTLLMSIGVQYGPGIGQKFVDGVIGGVGGEIGKRIFNRLRPRDKQALETAVSAQQPDSIAELISPLLAEDNILQADISKAIEESAQKVYGRAEPRLRDSDPRVICAVNQGLLERQSPPARSAIHSASRVRC